MYSNLTQRRNNRASKSKPLQPRHSNKSSMVVQTTQGYKIVPPLQNNVRKSLENIQTSNPNSNSRQPFFIPPDTTRTQIVQKKVQKPVIVSGPTPLPPAITPIQQQASIAAEGDKTTTEEASFRLPKKEDVLTLKHQSNPGTGFDDKQYIQGAALVPSTKILIRKFISSVGKTPSPDNFKFILSDSLRSIVNVRFVSVTVTYLVPAVMPTVGFIYLVDFPLETPFYYESGAGNRYSATFPILGASVGKTLSFQYTFPECYTLPFTAQSNTINQLDVKLFKEDTNGDFLAFTDIINCSMELEFVIGKLAVS